MIGGLRYKKDSRDYSHHQAFGTLSSVEIPLKDFVVAEPSEIKDQRSTDFCAAFSSTACSEDQEGVILSPEWQFAMSKKIEGNYKSWGLDIQTAMNSFRKFGSVEKKDAPFSVEDKDRDFLANWTNWPERLGEKAIEHTKKAFFKVDGPHDRFNNIRAALWQHRDSRRSIVTGAIWREDWTRATDGLIPKKYKKRGGAHAFKIFGQKIIKGEPYLMAQNSYGLSRGDRGIFYFPREVVNKEFTFGAYMFIDADTETIANLKTQYTLSMKLIDLLITYLSILKIKLGAWL